MTKPDNACKATMVPVSRVYFWQCSESQAMLQITLELLLMKYVLSFVSSLAQHQKFLGLWKVPRFTFGQYGMIPERVNSRIYIQQLNSRIKYCSRILAI